MARYSKHLLGFTFEAVKWEQIWDVSDMCRWGWFSIFKSHKPEFHVSKMFLLKSLLRPKESIVKFFVIFSTRAAYAGEGFIWSVKITSRVRKKRQYVDVFPHFNNDWHKKCLQSLIYTATFCAWLVFDFFTSATKTSIKQLIFSPSRQTHVIMKKWWKTWTQPEF